MKTPDYLTYDRYKKKKKTTSKKGVLLAITTFFATLLLFSIFAKLLSPDVDVSIGDDSTTDAKESGLGVKRFIDDRLKMIQMEDNSAGVSIKESAEKAPRYNDASFDKFSKSMEEKVDLSTRNNNDGKNISDSSMDDPVDEPIQYSHTPPRPSGRELSTPFESPKMSKVLVGRYSTVEQAKVAQGILLDSGIDVSPFIKSVGGVYTLQVGSYSNRAKADSLASELLRNNFPARVVQE